MENQVLFNIFLQNGLSTFKLNLSVSVVVAINDGQQEKRHFSLPFLYLKDQI